MLTGIHNFSSISHGTGCNAIVVLLSFLIKTVFQITHADIYRSNRLLSDHLYVSLATCLNAKDKIFQNCMKTNTDRSSTKDLGLHCNCSAAGRRSLLPLPVNVSIALLFGSRQPSHLKFCSKTSCI